MIEGDEDGRRHRLASAPCLAALEARDGAKKRALDLGLVAGDHRHRRVAIAQGGVDRVPPRRIVTRPFSGLAVEPRRLGPLGAPEPPGAEDNAFGQRFLDGISRRERLHHLVVEFVEIRLRFVEDDDLMRAKPMLQGISARHRPSRLGLGSRTPLRVPPVRLDLRLACHGAAPSPVYDAICVHMGAAIAAVKKGVILRCLVATCCGIGSAWCVLRLRPFDKLRSALRMRSFLSATNPIVLTLSWRPELREGRLSKGARSICKLVSRKAANAQSGSDLPSL